MKNEIKKLAEEIYRAGVALDGSDFAHKSDHFERLAGELYKAGYRKQSETVKEFAEKLLDKINNGGWSEDNIYRQGQQAMAGWVTKYIADLVEQYGKEDK